MFEQVLAFLGRLGEARMRLELGPTRHILDQLGSPDQRLRSVIVAGTNGKGSTCTFLTQIAMEAGWKVGTYTSPHLECVTERISINGHPIDEERFGRAGLELMKRLEHIQSDGITYFEFLTILAVEMFVHEAVDLAIFEVGLGGRLDATNALKRDAVGITAIDFDHEYLLGNSLTAIAREKGAIMRPGIPAILAEQKEEARIQLETQSRELGARLFPVKNDEDLPHLGLLGPHQTQNAQCAVAIARSLGLPESAILPGLSKAHLAGRLERWTNDKECEVWLDIAHNPSAAASLADFFLRENLGPFHLIWGMLKDKNAQEFLRPLQPFCASITLCTPRSPRAWNTETLRETLDLPNAEIISELETALSRRVSLSKRILCTGSFYLVGHARSFLRKRGFRVMKQAEA